MRSPRTALLQFILFCCIGVLNSAIDLGIFFLLTTIAAVPPLIANVVSFSCGASCSFLLNYSVTFRSGDRATGATLARFLLTAAITLGASSVSLAVLLLWLPPFAAKVATIAVTVMLGFALQKYFVFRIRQTA